MDAKNVISAIVLSESNNYILFKVAIHFAEAGKHVWFISSEPVDNIPKNISKPDKEILQMITFIYLKDYKDLISHLNGLHLWHKLPSVILLSSFDSYTDLYSSAYDTYRGALIAITLLDGVSVCARKCQNCSYLIIAASLPPPNYVDRLQIYHDMYFNNIVQQTEQNHKDDIFKMIIELYSILEK